MAPTHDQWGGFVILLVIVVGIAGPFVVSKAFPGLRLPDRWLLPGKLIRDYGTISEKSTLISIQRESLALCEKKGKYLLIFRRAMFTPLAWGINQSRIDLNKIDVLEQALVDIRRRQAEKMGRF